MSETFDPNWLELREGVDHRSRAADLLPPLRRWWSASGARAVLDLGAGTGSNLRYLAPRLPGAQAWTLVDHDAALLARVGAPESVVGGPTLDVSVRTLRGDLASTGLAEVDAAHLVTASALLDLVSEVWLTRLVGACADAGCAGAFALTYDGTVEWSGEADPLDTVVRDGVNAHQRRDKGLGPALGATAAARAAALFQERGYRTWLLPSPWQLGPSESELARRLVAGWVQAASEQLPREASRARQWGERRRDAITRGDTGLVVGHLDLLALPADGAAQSPSRPVPERARQPA